MKINGHKTEKTETGHLSWSKKSSGKFFLEANQNKNNGLVSTFYNKLKFPALFSVRNRWEKNAGDFNLS